MEKSKKPDLRTRKVNEAHQDNTYQKKQDAKEEELEAAIGLKELTTRDYFIYRVVKPTEEPIKDNEITCDTVDLNGLQPRS